jgi:predicted site-specific integrase-resolvase
MARQLQLYSLDEARKLLLKRGFKVSTRTLRRWIEQGKIAHHHLPDRPQQAGQWLLDNETIDAIAESGR